MQDAKQQGASAKGKARDDANWQLGWWELHPFVDRSKRPVAWSKSSVIFSAHPTQPLVLARHFSSSRQFVIPSPAPLVTSPTSYDPPTVISLSPTGEWLFAYFPGREGDGVACLWRRAFQLDSWFVRDFWTTPRGAGIVTAAWTNDNREWIISDAGLASRLPPRGPNMPVNSSVLLLITQALFINACFLPPYVPSLKILRAPLTIPSKITENEPTPSEYPGDKQGRGGRRVCVSAAIGFCYNDAAFLVATRSHLLPPYQASAHDAHSMDIALHHLDLAQATASDERILYDSDVWGEELVIDFCEVGVQIDPTNALNLGTRPLPSLFHPHPHLTDLSFFAVPPESAITQSPSATKDPRRQTKELPEKTGSFYLTAAVLDCGDYMTAPKSEVTVYACVRNTNPASKASPRWIISREHSKVFGNSILTFLEPSGTGNTVIAGLLDTSGVARRSSQSKPKQIPVGTCLALQFPSLDVDERWEPSHILSTTDRAGRDIPAGVAVSQNRVLVCCMSPSTASARTSVHPLPRRKPSLVPSSTLDEIPKGDLSRSLCIALLSRASPSDIIHILSLPTTSLHLAVTTLYNTLCTLAANANGLSEMWLVEMLGVLAEVYLGRARYSQGAEKDNMNAQWKTAHDVCSIDALNTAFEDCRDGDAYDLEAIWQMVGLSTWFVGFLERLMKECVAYHDEGPSSSDVSQENQGEFAGCLAITPAASPILVHAVHPYLHSHVLTAVRHVKQFRDHIGNLLAKTEHAQIAKDVLMDAIDCSGIHLDAMIPLLTDAGQIAAKIPQDSLRRCLTICAPVPSVIPQLKQIVERIVDGKVIDRPKLFIKASDLVDGVSQISLTDQNKGKDTDVVTKGLLLSRSSDMCCVRCGGKSELGGDGNVAGHISLRWRHWERVWATRCVCGGFWTRGASS